MAELKRTYIHSVAKRSGERTRPRVPAMPPSAPRTLSLLRRAWFSTSGLRRGRVRSPERRNGSRMFQHVTVLVSFIFAIALTHVFSSASQLLLARDRVRFSALLTVSMVN